MSGLCSRPLCLSAWTPHRLLNVTCFVLPSTRAGLSVPEILSVPIKSLVLFKAISASTLDVGSRNDSEMALSGVFSASSKPAIHPDGGWTDQELPSMDPDI